MYGVTSLGDRVYVVHNYDQDVEVYDARTMTLERHFPVPKLLEVSGITACPHYNCLYIGDWKLSGIHRVDLSRPKAVKKWSVARTAEALSVNGAHNVLVSCRDEDKVQEYTTFGDLVREIRLWGSLTSPGHAIQLSTGDYVVSQHTSPGVVSVVSADGRVQRSFQRREIKGKPLKLPVQMAVNKNGDILVSDRGNDRILAINSALTHAQEFPISADVALNSPYALWLDEAHDRLYVGETRGRRRLLVFSNVNCIRWKQ